MNKFLTYLIIILTISLLLPANSALASFNDVSKSHSNYKDIMYLLDKGIIEKSTNFGPSKIITREEAAVMISKAAGLDGTQRSTIFSDVPKSNKNSGYIQSAVEAGIITGYLNGTFQPNKKVTRGHMAAFIARAFDLPKGNKTFKDVRVGHTAYEAVKQLAAAKITTGYTDGTFKPQNNLTRAHISAFLARTIKSYEPKKLGSTRNNAAKINETVSINQKDFLDGEQNFELTLTEVIDGEEAWRMIKSANRYNSSPDSGKKYVLAKFRVNVISLENEPMDIYHGQFDVVSKNGIKYNDYISIVTPNPDLSTELYSGATYEGWTYFMVDENDSPKVVYGSGYESERWFDLGL